MKTVIVTGGAGDIGSATIHAYHMQGYNVVIADLPHLERNAKDILSSLSDPSRALYIPTDVTSWKDMQHLFRETKHKFGRVDVVVANAGLMESKGFFDFSGEEDEQGELNEPFEAWRVVDVNLKGGMNSKCPRISTTLHGH
jgi:NAD(P)-dependent dehydrogenase (short-subunit alcohol dehydrogenase family)